MSDAHGQLRKIRTYLAMLEPFADEMVTCQTGRDCLNILDEYSEYALLYAYKHFTNLVEQERERQLRQMAS